VANPSARLHHLQDTAGRGRGIEGANQLADAGRVDRGQP
jgi:hypothetical protein